MAISEIERKKLALELAKAETIIAIEVENQVLYRGIDENSNNLTDRHLYQLWQYLKLLQNSP